jgi:peptidoglycan L-alanyl-D-glutamate endopeptidase CwlK
MAKFGNLSLKRLLTCDEKIQKIMNEAIKYYDFSILYGHRTTKEQFELFRQGRDLVGGEWVKTGKTVTNLDGKFKLSEHNYLPSRAIDIAPYPIDWNDIERFKELAVIVKREAKKLDIDITWGGDWKMRDFPHYQVDK